MTAPNDINSWWGRDVADRHGDTIGTVDEVYLDPTTGEPTWVAVKTGLLGTHSSLAPLAGASVTATHITVGFDKAAVKNVPDVVTDGELTPQNEDRLYHYYRLDRPTPTPPRVGVPAPPDGARERPRNRADADDDGGDHAGGSAGSAPGRARGSSLGAAFSDAARSIGQAATQEVRQARENAAQCRNRPDPTHHQSTDQGQSLGGREAAGVDTTGQGQTVPADHENTGRGDTDAGDPLVGVARVRRHVVTEYLSATGEVLRRSTHTEEDHPDTG